MHAIKIDAEVFEFLQRQARPFVDTPNSTLRRILKLDKVIPHSDGPEAQDHDLSELLEAGAGTRRKALKTDLKELIRSGLVKEGQMLYLVDYQGRRVPDMQANIAGQLLAYQGQFFSMSSLAEGLLKKVGFKSNSVRGPAHWVNGDGVSMQTLWAQLMGARAKV